MNNSGNKNISFASLAFSLSSDYCNLYVIDSSDDSYVEYAPAGAEKELAVVSSGPDFYSDVPKNCRELVYIEDQEHFLKTFRKENVLNALENGRSFSLNYRLVINGEPQHYFLKTIRSADEKNIIIGVRNVNEEKLREQEQNEKNLIYSQIAGTLASRYEVIYYIDVKTGEYRIYSASKEYSDLGTTIEGADFFADCERDIRKLIHPEDRKMVLEMFDKNNLIRAIEKNGSASCSYRQVLEDRQQYVEMLAMFAKDDHSHIVVGVANVDEQTRHEQEVAKMTKTFSDISTALTQRYEVIYYVNAVNDDYTEYCTSPQYSWASEGSYGRDFFNECQRNMPGCIYKDDLEMMQRSMNKENFLDTIDTDGEMNRTYRLVVKGEPEYVALYAVRAAEGSDYIIIAVSNIDKVKKMEFALQDAVFKAERDALTGVKSKYAYVEAENELDRQIGNGTQPPFGVVVCDINGLKKVNDTMGHKAGDEYIRSACSIICDAFKHSPVYRIGGDEFVILLKGQDYDSRSELAGNMIRSLEANKYNGIPLFAYGISDFDADMDMRVQDVFERADMLMYKNKEKSKCCRIQ